MSSASPAGFPSPDVRRVGEREARGEPRAGVFPKFCGEGAPGRRQGAGRRGLPSLTGRFSPPTFCVCGRYRAYFHQHSSICKRNIPHHPHNHTHRIPHRTTLRSSLSLACIFIFTRSPALAGEFPNGSDVVVVYVVVRVFPLLCLVSQGRASLATRNVDLTVARIFHVPQIHHERG